MKRTMIVLAVMLIFPATCLAEGGHGPHWTYEGHEGPEHWGALSPDFKACSEGSNQSPIDIQGQALSDLEDITFIYNASKGSIVNNGHTIQVNCDKGSSIKVNGKTYELLQFHFHGPSEHTINGKSFDLELHLVHKNVDGELAVIGVMIEKGAHNNGLDEIWGKFPQEAGEKEALDQPIDIAAVMPRSKTYITYQGSLTTPPCTEGVAWFVLKTPIQMSGEQLEEFAHIIKKNNRPVQPLNNRKIGEDKD
ncbi:MAG: carbonic anhydrase [Deltaproteobacteria bacterium]|nr:carbonic anhydrase [Deltaproteobacteria bacterium]